MNLKLALLDWAIVRPAAIAFENVNDDRRHMCALPFKADMCRCGTTTHARSEPTADMSRKQD